MDCEKSSQILRSLAEYMQFLCSKHLSHDISITFSGQLYLCVDKQTHNKIELILDEELTRSDQPNIVHTSNSYSTTVKQLNSGRLSRKRKIHTEKKERCFSSKGIRYKRSALSSLSTAKNNISKKKCPSVTSTLSKVISKEKSATSQSQIEHFEQSSSAAPELDLDFEVYSCEGSVADVRDYDFVVTIDKPREDCADKSALVTSIEKNPSEAVISTPISNQMQENDHDIKGKYLKFYHQFHSLMIFY